MLLWPCELFGNPDFLKVRIPEFGTVGTRAAFTLPETNPPASGSAKHVLGT